MNKTGHLIGGIIINVGMIYYTKDFDVVNTLGIMAGSFIPDIDSKSSFISHKVKINPVAIVNDIIPNNFTKHRGILFHSMWTILILIGIMYYFKFQWLYGLIIGIFGHHILDCLTKRKLPNYFYPINLKKILK